MDTEIHEALTLGGEAGAGPAPPGGAGAGEVRGPRGAKKGARPPAHLHAALVKHHAAHALLASVIPHHYKVRASITNLQIFNIGSFFVIRMLTFPLFFLLWFQFTLT